MKSFDPRRGRTLYSPLPMLSHLPMASRLVPSKFQGVFALLSDTLTPVPLMQRSVETLWQTSAKHLLAAARGGMIAGKGNPIYTRLYRRDLLSYLSPKPALTKP